MQSNSYDVVIVGGAFTGAATALLLRRWLPEKKILVIEKSLEFDRKVGEATVEITSMFLSRVLGLNDYLSRQHLPKHGLRYWFSKHEDDRLTSMTEVGPKVVPGLPSFFLDRAKLDRDLLQMAVDEGVELLRPARVRKVELGWPQSTVTVTTEDAPEARTLQTRWLLDASGRSALLGRHLGLMQRADEHPTAALWARWNDVKRLDAPDLMGEDPLAPGLPQISAMRSLATNHFCGYGWWTWLIPLQDGSTSIGVVYNKELVEWPQDGSPRERFESFIRQQPGLRELVAEAEIDGDDFHTFSHLPYSIDQYMDKGWAALGDAAGFLDPYYSPGLDHSVISLFATALLVRDDLRGDLTEDQLDSRVDEHNDTFLRSFKRWLHALYVGKYEVFGDAELTTAAFLIDTGLYYTFIVTPVHRSLEELKVPLFGADHPATAIAFHTMRTINTRLKHLARFRRALGIYGKRNTDWRLLVRPFGVRLGSIGLIGRGLMIWGRAEVETAWARLRHGLLQRPKATRERVGSPNIAEPELP